MTETTRTLTVDGLFNLRDLGGLRAGDRTVLPGRVLRSDGLFRLTDTGREQLDALGVATALDLRDDAERAHQPSLVSDAVTVVPTPMFQGAAQSVRDGISLEALYRDLLDGFGENYAVAVRRLATHDERPVLVHCTAGKDRTGTVVALALSAIGVDRDEIIADYALTEQNLAGQWVDAHIDMLDRFGVAITPELMRLVGGSPASAMAETLDYVAERYGSARAYLLGNGVTEAELAALERRLLGEA